jgi:hypothetical protein
VGDPGTVVVAGHWGRSSELAYATRTIAGAASRLGPVSVLVPAPAGTRQADGAFDLVGMDDDGRYRWPDDVPRDGTVLVDEVTPEIATLVSEIRPRASFTMGPSIRPLETTWRRIPLVPGEGRPFVGLHVPVHPMAAGHRHGGFGFTGYLLVLSDRTEASEEPPAAAAWLTAAFHDTYVVVIEGATAWAWRGRSLRGSSHVDTRIDLWRLVAHANLCVDLAPGGLIARECVEALRFGTPIMVPRGSGVAAAHATASGGCTFADHGELVTRAAALRDESRRARASALASRYAEAHYGDPAALVARLDALWRSG